LAARKVVSVDARRGAGPLHLNVAQSRELSLDARRGSDATDVAQSRDARRASAPRYLPGRPPPPHLSPFVDYDDAVAEEAEAEAEAVDEEDAPLRDADADAEQSLEAQQAHEMAKTMMSKKARRLYDRMQHGKQRKAQAQQRLRQKRLLIQRRKS